MAVFYYGKNPLQIAMVPLHYSVTLTVTNPIRRSDSDDNRCFGFEKAVQ